MRELNLGVQRAAQNFHLLNRRENTPFGANPGAASRYEHLFSYKLSDTSIADAAIDIIRHAQRKVFLASFRIGDGPMLDALYETVGRLRGGVYVITSWDEKALRQGSAELGDDDDLTEDEIKAQNKRFDDMTRRGIIVRGHPSCHAKFLLADDAIALVSSANLETSALRDRTDRYVTGESGAVITDTGEVGLLARFFTRLWFEGCTGEARPGAHYVLRSRRREPSPCTVVPSLTTPSAGVIWTHDDEHGILDAIVDIASCATHELLIASYNLVGLSERPDLLLDTLARALERGVRVSLLLRGRNLPRDLRDAAALAALGVELHPDSLTHVKGVIADGRHGALFSANLDFDHGLINGVEVGVRLDGTPALVEARRFFMHAMRNADMKFTPCPAQAELDSAYPARWRKQWPFAGTLAVTATDAVWHSFTEAAQRPPILYETTDSGPITLHAGRRSWSLVRGGQTWRLEASARTNNEKEPLDLMADWSKRRSATESAAATARRGFIPAILIRQ
ncbi:MAG TPA: phospholipase D-like domain-containing protein [Candidatus Limnocylindrales bacterium]|nr:phospholipase D-like domain-containing protein [Candidatus Limnocylindrales bacterium]